MAPKRKVTKPAAAKNPSTKSTGEKFPLTEEDWKTAVALIRFGNVQSDNAHISKKLGITRNTWNCRLFRLRNKMNQIHLDTVEDSDKSDDEAGPSSPPPTDSADNDKGKKVRRNAKVKDKMQGPVDAGESKGKPKKESKKRTKKEPKPKKASKDSESEEPKDSEDPNKDSEEPNKDSEEPNEEVKEPELKETPMELEDMFVVF